MDASAGLPLMGNSTAPAGGKPKVVQGVANGTGSASIYNKAKDNRNTPNAGRHSNEV